MGPRQQAGQGDELHVPAGVDHLLSDGIDRLRDEEAARTSGCERRRDDGEVAQELTYSGSARWPPLQLHDNRPAAGPVDQIGDLPTWQSHLATLQSQRKAGRLDEQLGVADEM